MFSQSVEGWPPPKKKIKDPPYAPYCPTTVHCPMCPHVSLCVPLCPPVSLYQLHPLSGQRLLGCPRENHSTLHIFSKYPPATNVHNMHIHVHSIINSTHGGWLFNGCPTAQPTTECKKRICPKKLSKSRQSGLPCENLEHQKINDTNHDFFRCDSISL